MGQQGAKQHLHYGLPEGEENEQVVTKLFEEIMNKMLLNLVKENVTQVREAQRVLNEVYLKRTKARHITIKFA